MRLSILAPVAATLLASPVLSQTWVILPLAVEGDVQADGSLLTSVRDIVVSGDLDWRAVIGTDHVDNDLDRLVIGPAGLVQQENQALAFPAGTVIDDFLGMDMDGAGNLLQRVNLDGPNIPGSFDGALLLNGQVILQEGDPCNAPQLGPGSFYRTLRSVSFANNGKILISASIDDSAIPGNTEDAMLLVTIDSNGSIVAEEALAVEGHGPTSGPTTDVYYTAQSTDVNGIGQHIFSSQVDFLLAGIRDVIQVGPLTVATEGFASTQPGRFWLDISGEPVTINNNGSYAFWGEITGAPASAELIVKDGVKFKQLNDPMPGMPGLVITDFRSGTMDLADDGSLLWYAEWDSGDLSKDSGLLVNDQLIVQEGVTMVGGLVIDTLASATNSYFITDNGNSVVFEANLSGGINGVFVATKVQGSTSFVPGCNPSGGLMLASSGTPSIGSSMTLNFQQAQSSPAGVYFVIAPTSGVDASNCGLTLPGFGEVLVGLTPLPEVLPIGVFTGAPLPLVLPIPSDPSLIGISIFSQGMFIDPANLSEQVRLTNGLKFTIGL